MTTKPIGLYLHVPFCVRKCNYCDFCSYPISNAEWKEKYIEALLSEIYSYAERNLQVDSVFFGGGTPSLLSLSEFDRIVSCIDKAFSLSRDTEFSMELNPGTLSNEKMRHFAEFGVNRVSIGLQSIHEKELKKLGRIHNFDEFAKAYEATLSAGIDNVNVDLMYGIPEQTINSFSETLEKILSLSPKHLSLYGLILEEGTPFFDMRDTLNLPSEDEECDMYYLAAEKLEKAGYSHYEISNYAKAGYECRHNLKYWRDQSYIGVGASAYSYFDGKRFGNSSVIDEYLSSNREKYMYEEIISKEEEAYEYAMLRLRLAEGFSLKEYESKFGKSFCSNERMKKISNYQKFGYINLSGDRLSLSDKGFYISNKILTELL